MTADAANEGASMKWILKTGRGGLKTNQGGLKVVSDDVHSLLEVEPLLKKSIKTSKFLCKALTHNTSWTRPIKLLVEILKEGAAMRGHSVGRRLQRCYKSID